MLQMLGYYDWLVFAILTIFLIGSGIWAGRQKKNAEDYFMAGRTLRWWSVAGSIYGANVSLSQIIGMLGIGYSIGFAQSHYEILAIPAIIFLCYVFIPVYRQRGVFTLSAYLEHRYSAGTRLIYSICIIGIILILLVGGLYIGSRQLGLLFSIGNFSLTYLQGIIFIAFISCCLICWGGMQSLVVIENIISILMVSSLVLVGWLTLNRSEIGGLLGLVELDKSATGLHKMRLYLPSNHPDLPWTGVCSGLLVLQGFFWTTNQFEVQRVLSAQSNRDAQLGALAAGFLKLTIPFFSIAAGVAAAYLFKNNWHLEGVQPDDAFVVLMSKVVPPGYGLFGWILAGLTAAIFSSIYSMLNAASTLLTVDIYQKYFYPSATDKQLVMAGRWFVICLTALAVLLAYGTFTPNSGGNFFLVLSKNSSYLKPGIVTIFFMGVCFKKIHPSSAVAVLLVSPLLSWAVEFVYDHYFSTIPLLRTYLGVQINFLHRVMIVFILCILIQFALSYWLHRKQPYAKSVNNMDVMGSTKKIILPMSIFIAGHLIFLYLIHVGVPLAFISWVAAGFTATVFFGLRFFSNTRKNTVVSKSFFASTDFYAGLLTGITVWILYYFS
ncbi:MAG: sodium:solute symporter [Chitinophagia bacterium]|nr:sodium:solute symporter [Chitinophagia bacterium]